MLTTLRLRNFKGFRDQVIEFQQFSVVIGRNNAGKSSAFEAIRILANAISKFASGKFVPSPSWTNGAGVGITLPVDDQQRKPETLFFRYKDPPAIITATFANGAKVDVFIGVGGIIFAEAFTPKQCPVDSRSRARECEFSPISILPQIRPLEDYETVLRAEYVRKCIDTHLSSRHFRNQLRYQQDHFESFRDLFQQTWQGLRVCEFIAPDALHEDELALMLMDDGFVAEAANFGHGLQMWLQIIWFIARTPSNSIVVLDEPDVYMHPEQQSRMISLLRDRYQQCLVSTHSEQIIKACSSAEIMRLHRSLPVSKHGVSQGKYDRELEEIRQIDLEKQRTLSAHGIEPDRRTHSIKFVLFGDSKISIWDSQGELVKAIKCKRQGEKHSFSLAADKYRISMLMPEDIELHVDGESRSYIGRSDQDYVEFDLHL